MTCGWTRTLWAALLSSVTAYSAGRANLCLLCSKCNATKNHIARNVDFYIYIYLSADQVNKHAMTHPRSPFIKEIRRQRVCGWSCGIEPFKPHTHTQTHKHTHAHTHHTHAHMYFFYLRQVTLNYMTQTQNAIFLEHSLNPKKNPQHDKKKAASSPTWHVTYSQ